MNLGEKICFQSTFVEAIPYQPWNYVNNIVYTGTEELVWESVYDAVHDQIELILHTRE